MTQEKKSVNKFAIPKSFQNLLSILSFISFLSTHSSDCFRDNIHNVSTRRQAVLLISVHILKDHLIKKEVGKLQMTTELYILKQLLQNSISSIFPVTDTYFIL